MNKHRKFEGFINTIDQHGTHLTKQQEGVNVNLIFNKNGTPTSAEIYSDDCEEYADVGLSWDGKTLVDYDGVFELPFPVIQFLRDEGWVVPKEFEE